MNAFLDLEGLHVEYSIVSDSASVLGFHYYYGLPQEKGTVYFQDLATHFRDGEVTKNVPESWKNKEGLCFDLAHSADYGFYSKVNPLQGKVVLDTGDYKLVISYETQSQENSWQLYHPEGSSFVCIEPLTAHDPHKPILSVSSLKLDLNLF